LPTDAQILDADLAQGEIEVTEHDVEEGLRQGRAIRLAMQAIDHQRGMQGECVEPAIERIGNAAPLEQLGRARPRGGALVEPGGEVVSRLAAAKQVRLPLSSDIRPRLTPGRRRDMVCALCFPDRRHRPCVAPSRSSSLAP